MVAHRRCRRHSGIALAFAILGLTLPPTIGVVPWFGEGSALAEADADVAILASLTVSFDDRGRFAAIHEKWTFGYDYSATARVQLDTDGNGVLDQIELDKAPNETLSWIGGFDYFTRITEDGQPVPRGPAEDVGVAFQAGRMVFEFTLPLTSPPRLAIQPSRFQTRSSSTTSNTIPPTSPSKAHRRIAV